MIVIRKIEPADYQKTGDMIKTTIKISFKKIQTESLINDFCRKYDLDNFTIRAQNIEMFIATENDNIVGVIGIKENQLRTFYVHPDYQGKGVGSKLYKKFEEVARERGIKKVIVESSPLGLPIYEHFGFVKYGILNKERAGQKYVVVLLEKQL